MKLGGGSGVTQSVDVTADQYSVGETGTLGETKTISNGAVAEVDNFTNVAGETVSFKLNGTSISFTAAGTADQSTNATRMAAAIEAAGITNIKAKRRRYLSLHQRIQWV